MEGELCEVHVVCKLTVQCVLCVVHVCSVSTCSLYNVCINQYCVVLVMCHVYSVLSALHCTALYCVCSVLCRHCVRVCVVY